jgi:hypothetical protein
MHALFSLLPLVAAILLDRAGTRRLGGAAGRHAGRAAPPPRGCSSAPVHDAHAGVGGSAHHRRRRVRPRRSGHGADRCFPAAGHAFGMDGLPSRAHHGHLGWHMAAHPRRDVVLGHLRHIRSQPPANRPRRADARVRRKEPRGIVATLALGAIGVPNRLMPLRPARVPTVQSTQRFP